MVSRTLISESACQLTLSDSGRFTARNKDGTFSSSKSIDFILDRVSDACKNRHEYRRIMEEALAEGTPEPAPAPEEPPAPETRPARLTVLVRGPDQQPLPGARVTFQGNSRTTSSSGEVVFETRDFEDVQVRVEASGFDARTGTARLREGEPAALVFTLTRIGGGPAPMPEPEPVPEPEAPRDFVQEIVQAAQDGDFEQAGRILQEGAVAASEALQAYVRDDFLGFEREPETIRDQSFRVAIGLFPVGKAGSGVKAAEGAITTLGREGAELGLSGLSRRLGVSKEELIRRYGDVIQRAQAEGAGRAVIEDAVRRTIQKESEAFVREPAISGVSGLVQGLRNVATPALTLVTAAGTALGIGFLSGFLQEEGLNAVQFSTSDLLDSLTFERNPERRQELIRTIESNLGVWERLIASLDTAVAGAAQLNPFTVEGFRLFRDSSRASLESSRTQFENLQTATPPGTGEPAEDGRTGFEFTSNESPFELQVGAFGSTVRSPFVLEVAPGNYSYVARKAGFRELSGGIFVEEGQVKPVALTFVPEPSRQEEGRGTVTYEAFDAETKESLFVDWFLDGVLVKSSSTFLEIVMDPGSTFEVMARRSGFGDATDIFVLEEGPNPTQQFSLARVPEEDMPEEDRPARVSVKANVQEGRIFVDDAFTFETTDTVIIITPGAHKITVKKPGFRDASVNVSVAPGQTVEALLTLEPLPEEPEPAPEEEPLFRGYEVLFRSTPTGASIYVNGENSFRITNGSVKLLPGTYTITLRKFGFEDDVFDLTLEEY